MSKRSAQTGKSAITSPLIQLPLSAAIALAAGWHCAYASDEALEQVEVKGYPYTQVTPSGDAAELLRNQGVNFFSAGGVSSLPVLRGLNDDRVKLVLDGAENTSACANHMNPALSYMDASRVSSVDVMAGITPVSEGGDSIAGTILLQSQAPEYAENGPSTLQKGTVGYHYRSNNRNHGVTASALVASEQFSLGYSGANDKAESYRDGDGHKVLDTLYRRESHTLTLGARGEVQELILRLSHQEVPYQGFPNQYMDMVGNVSNSINLQYLRTLDWGTLDTRLLWQDVDHEMGFFSAEKPGTMPMLTEGRDIGYKIRAELPLSDSHTVRLGHEVLRFTLDDWWPAVAGSMMMGPNDYININNGERTRYALYAESEHHYSGQWESLAGIRYEHVVSDADAVQPYNTMPRIMGMPNQDLTAATAFNRRNHQRNDDNIDLTLLARYTHSDQANLEFGYARKSRSPNLYERYSWGRNTMAMTMIGWFGDGNGYVGDLNLDSEIAHTLSATFNLKSQEAERWSLSLSPYYTYVDDYIDAEVIGSFRPRSVATVTRPLLQFVNADAELFGAEMKGQYLLAETQAGARWQAEASAALTRGERKQGGDGLYQIMPLNAKVALTHQWQQWESRFEVEWVDDKTRVDARRSENRTDSYTLFNAQTQYQMQPFTLTLGVRNLLDETYEQPMGGVYLSGWLAGDRSGNFAAIPGQGRSVDAGISYQF